MLNQTTHFVNLSCSFFRRPSSQINVFSNFSTTILISSSTCAVVNSFDLFLSFEFRGAAEPYELTQC